MKKKDTPLGLSAIIIKIKGHTGQFIASNRLEDYKTLNNYLKEIKNCIEPFVWLERNSIDDIDYDTTVPLMSDMIQCINDFKIKSTLHFWHYHENNNEDKLDQMIELVERFLFFKHYLINCVNRNTGGCNPRYFFV